MHLEFWGAVEGVTGSMHLLEFEGIRILMDCGMFQGRRKQAFEQNRDLPFKTEQLHSLVLSHSHIDHSGNIPTLVKGGFKGPVFATRATQDLCSAMLRDSAKIQERDVEFVNRRRRKQGKNLFEPLYTMDDAEAALFHFHGVPYDRSFHILRRVKCTFFDAGHILGSAVSLFEIGDEAASQRLLYTGDLGRFDAPILRDPRVPKGGADWLIMESTYGDKSHVPAVDTPKLIAEAIGPAIARGGKVIIPCFSVGRTQEIVYHLRNLWVDGVLPRVPVFVDSPLSVNVTEVFRHHPECYDREVRDRLLEDGSTDPFGFETLTYIRDVEESKALNGRRGPCIIVSSSGMCEAGRILHHLRNSVEDPNNMVLIVGYMAEHTLGRRLVERQPEVKILGDPHRLRAEVKVISSLSAHADSDELMSYVEGLQRERALQKIFLVHGEDGPQEALAQRLRKEFAAEVIRPERGKVYPLP
jgi:metallo-beta-lactamase family protein